MNPATAGPSGPIDPDLTVLSIRDLEDRPLAVLGNFSMHYYGAANLSSDFTGRVCRLLEEALGEGPGEGEPFVALMSQGTSGDLHFMDYALPADRQPFKGKPDGFERYCRGLAGLALEVMRDAAHRPDVTIAMAEARLTLKRRVPDEARLAWAAPIVAGIQGAPGSRGKLFFDNGNPDQQPLVGRTKLELRRWYHVAVVRDGPRLRVYLDGDPQPEIDAAAAVTRPGNSSFFVGGRSDGMFGFEGRIDEVALFDRALEKKEVTGCWEKPPTK